MLFYAGLGLQVPYFPSWIPDWTKSVPPRLLQPDVLGLNAKIPTLDAIYRASGRKRAHIYYDSKKDFLIARGGLVDQIGRIGGNDDGLNNILHRSIFHTVDAEKIIGSLTSYPTGEDPSDVEWRTCIGNRVKAIAKDGPFLGAWSGEFSEPSPDLRQGYLA